MNMNRKAGWLFAAVTWFCVNVEAQTTNYIINGTPTNSVAFSNTIANIDWKLMASAFGYKRKTAVDNVPYELMYWNTDTNYTGQTRIMGMRMSVVYPARIEIFKMPESVKIGETNGWYSETGCDDVAIVRSVLPPLTVEWLGSPITGEALGGGPAKGLLDQRQKADVKIGLRSDGVVIWRKRE